VLRFECDLLDVEYYFVICIHGVGIAFVPAHRAYRFDTMVVNHEQQLHVRKREMDVRCYGLLCEGTSLKFLRITSSWMT
jgi:hypothetical protein